MKVLSEYPGSHHYFYTFRKSEYFCPHCSSKTLWTNRMGDYYVGSRYLCTNCSGVSYLDHCNKTPSDNELFMIEQLVSGKTKTPTTPIGN